MNQKISDFKVAEYILRLFCKRSGVHFVDLPVVFGQTGEDGVRDSKLFISQSDSYPKTLFRIVATYLSSLPKISGEHVNDGVTSELIQTAAAMVRDFTIAKNVFNEANEKLPVTLSLNRDPFVWFAMRDIICPSYQKALTNVRVIAGKSGVLDAAQCIDEAKFDITMVVGGDGGELSIKEEHLPFIFVNMGVESYPYRAAFILREAMKIHGLDPKIVIRELLTHTELSEKFLGLVKIAFVDDEAITDFVMMLGILGDFDNAYMVIDKSQFKSAQVGQSPEHSPSSFWQLGLTENMLGPARGSDWSTYFRLKPFTDKLWKKVEQEKRRRGLKELPMELLLRVQSEPHKTRPDLILQGLLADNRVW
jgi:hypothetical protein